MDKIVELQTSPTSAEIEWHASKEENDLIDFHVSSPSISRTCSNSSLPTTSTTAAATHSDEIKHLLDSELSHFEEVLQKQQQDATDKTETFSNFSTDTTDGTGRDDESQVVELIDLNEFIDNHQLQRKPTKSYQHNALLRSNSELLLDFFDYYHDQATTEAYEQQQFSRSKSTNDLELFSFGNGIEKLIELDDLDPLNELCFNLDQKKQDNNLSLLDTGPPISATIEECLIDLDKYLQECEKQTCENGQINFGFISDIPTENLSKHQTLPHNFKRKEQRQRNQRKLSLDNSIKLNVDSKKEIEIADENHFKRVGNPLRNTLSATTAARIIIKPELKRKCYARNTFSGFQYRKRKKNNYKYLEHKKSEHSDNDDNDEDEDDCDDEDIDWSWVYEIDAKEKKNKEHQSVADKETIQNVERPVLLHKRNSSVTHTNSSNICSHHANITGNCAARDEGQQQQQSNTTPQESSTQRQQQTSENNSNCSADRVETIDNDGEMLKTSPEANENEINSDARRQNKQRSWLRTSMRRVQHFRLPDTEDIPLPSSMAIAASSVATPTTTNVVTTVSPPQQPSATTIIMDNLTPVLTVRHDSRPTSAPNRLAFTQNFQYPQRISVHPAGVNSEVPVNRSRSVNRRDSRRSHRQSRPTVRSSSSDHRARSSSESSRSRRPRSVSSTDSSIGSSIETTPSCSPVDTPDRNTLDGLTQTASRRSCDPPPISNLPTTNRRLDDVSRPVGLHGYQQSRASNTGRPPGGGGGGGGGIGGNNHGGSNNNSHGDHHSPFGQWNHRFSSMLASLGCTLGIFNISRFAILSIHFGANFIVQFLVLSLIFGIPLFTLHTCLGQQLGAGVIDMWRISPIFQGAGIALLVAQALIGMYSIIGISWLFVFFRDSFITKMDNYKWAEPFDLYRYDQQKLENGSYKIAETIPDYFNGQVLQRYNLAFPGHNGDTYGNIKFQVCFNLAVVWIIVFVSLSKGLKSYGKVVFLFTLLPLFTMFILCAKLLGLTPSSARHGVFSETSWPEFFLNTKCWVAAFQEAFLTWGLFGAAAMQIASHNKHKHLLQRDMGLVVVITCTVLLLAAFLGNTCVEVLKFYGYNYLPGSFETTKSYIFLRNVRQPLPPSLATTPVRYMMHSSLILGERVIRPGIDRASESGYQPLRLATELIPATFTIIGPDQLSPFWAVLFYFVMILFGISQQLAIWHCVITGIMAIKAKTLKAWQTSVTFFSCAISFLIGILMTTEFGIFTVYFFDFCVGGTWWVAILYMVLVSAVFMVRGRPYSGDSVVQALFTPGSHQCLVQWAGPLLSFTWNVVLPVALVVYCISTFKNGNFRELYTWHHAPAYDYWPLWTRQLGTFMQLLPILTIPITAFVQSYRYLNNGPPDILDRIQLLYRPPLDSEHMDDPSTYTNNRSAPTNTTNSATTTDPAFEDPPPKYTPPPSYTTATGARIAKLLRQSIRRSVRRIANVLGESSDSHQSQASNQQHHTSSVGPTQLEPPPPDYAAVLVEMNQSPHVAVSVTDSSDPYPTVRNVYNSETNRSANNTSDRRTNSTSLTAADVANILRSSIRRSTIRAANTIRRSLASEESTSGSLSVVCLVDGAEPIGQDSSGMNQIAQQKDDQKNENLSSVI